ncbi:hypothetical protein J0910_18995 [Nocardiopsis sp. CNT-189]|uniref:hypothetical protein n=1 Tax=Nocardiopsis oceanisediminis TaxID=2816862 RepID=UPI003B2D1452
MDIIGALEAAFFNFANVPILVQVAANMAIGFLLAFPVALMYQRTRLRDVQESNHAQHGVLKAKEAELDAMPEKYLSVDSSQFTETPHNARAAIAGLDAAAAEHGSELYHGTKRTRKMAWSVTKEATAGGRSSWEKKDRLTRAGFRVGGPVPMTNRPRSR